MTRNATGESGVRAAATAADHADEATTAAWAADYAACRAGLHGPAWRTRAEREGRRGREAHDPDFARAWAQVRLFLAA